MSFFRQVFQRVAINPRDTLDEGQVLVPVVCCDVFGTILRHDGSLRPGFPEFLLWLHERDDVKIELVSSDPAMATRALRDAGLPPNLFPQGVSLKDSALARLGRAGRIAVMIDDERLLTALHDVAYAIDPRQASFKRFLEEASYRHVQDELAAEEAQSTQERPLVVLHRMAGCGL